MPSTGATDFLKHLSKNFHVKRESCIETLIFHGTVLMDVCVCVLQVVKGIRYNIDFEISRTVCHKRGNNSDLENCDFQPKGPLHQVRTGRMFVPADTLIY